MAAQKVVVEGSSDVTASQLKDLFRQIADRSITGAHLQAFLEHKNPFEEPAVLGEPTTVPAGRLAKPFEWTTRPGLYVHGDAPARELFALVGSVTKPKTTKAMVRRDVLCTTDDATIDAIPADPEVEPEDIAAAIVKQWGGKSGPLLTNGFYNRFRCRGFVVDVRWGGTGQDWIVLVWRPGGSRCSEGCRAFSRN